MVNPCPERHLAISLAVAYGDLLWTRLRCDGTFWPKNALAEEAVYAHVRPHGEEYCEVLMQQIGGELRVLLDVSFIEKPSPGILPALHECVHGAAMRLNRGEKWGEVTSRLCALDSRVGYMPLTRPVSSRIRAFAVKALNEDRSARKCGSPVHVVTPKGAEDPVPKAAIMGRSVQVQFPLVLGTSPAVTQLVFVAVELFKQWDYAAGAEKGDVLTFLGSDPSPCDVARLESGTFSHHITSVAEAWWAHAPSRFGPPPDALKGTQDELMKHNLDHLLLLLPKSKAVTADVLRKKQIDRLPTSYNLRTVAPQCVQKVRALGRCIQSWALAAIGAFEKQLCFLTQGEVNVNISAQHILDCAVGEGYSWEGRLEDAYKFLYTSGAVREECSPWSAFRGLDSQTEEDLAMPIESLMPPDNFTLRFAGRPVPHTARHCFANDPPGEGQAFGQTAGNCIERFRARVLTERERVVNIWPGAPPGVMVVTGMRMLQAIIFGYGAIASTVEVYPDFMDYQGGVYLRSPGLSTHDMLGLANVQLFGWGKEPGFDGSRYWIGENSFGSAWGEGGYFRWSRGQDHLGIESFAQLGLVAGIFPLEVDNIEPSSRSSSGAGHDDIVGRPHEDMLLSLEGQVTSMQDEATLLRAVNWWLTCTSIVFAFTACTSVIISLRRCLIFDEDDEHDAFGSEEK